MKQIEFSRIWKLIKNIVDLNLSHVSQYIEAKYFFKILFNYDSLKIKWKITFKARPFVVVDKSSASRNSTTQLMLRALEKVRCESYFKCTG